MSTSIHRRVDRLRSGEDPSFIERVPSGWVVMGDPQVLAGYCLLLPDPVVPSLNALDARARTEFLADMAALGDAVLAATGALRINYAILGNLDPALHAHVIPRYLHEPEGNRTAHPWTYDWGAAAKFDAAAQAPLIAAIRSRLSRAG